MKVSERIGCQCPCDAAAIDMEGVTSNHPIPIYFVIDFQMKTAMVPSTGRHFSGTVNVAPNESNKMRGGSWGIGHCLSLFATGEGVFVLYCLL